MSPKKKKSEHLWIAATEGNLAHVKQLCADPEVNVQWQDDEHQRTPFFRACGHGRTEVVRFMLGLPNLDVNLLQKEAATPFSIACQEGHVDVVKLLLADPRVAFNIPDDHGRSAFYMACKNGKEEIAVLLMPDERIDLHRPASDGATPFSIACEKGFLGLVALLLTDPRVDCNLSRNDETTPLWFASQNGHLSLVQHILASGREIDTKKVSSFNHTTAAEQARSLASREVKPEVESEENFLRRKQNGDAIADLIDSFQVNPAAVRSQLRKQLGIDKSLAGELFALAVYLSDGYLTFGCEAQVGDDAGANARKFFSIVVQLPMDLQMVLCNRAFGVAPSIVKNLDAEKGFKKFARGF